MKVENIYFDENGVEGEGDVSSNISLFGIGDNSDSFS